MKDIWIWFLPLLYLPSFGFSGQTAFGALEISDILIIPFLLLTLFAEKIRHPILANKVMRIGLLFVLWTIVSSATIYLRFEYVKAGKITLFSFFKIAKFALYATAGLYVSKLIVNRRILEKLHWSLLYCGLVLSISLIFTGVTGSTHSQLTAAYKAMNLISVIMALFITYLGCLYLARYRQGKWRNLAILALPIMGLGFTFSQGRGGWLAAIVGYVYFSFRKGVRVGLMVSIVSALVASVLLYENNEFFRREINRTLLLEEYAAQYGDSQVSFDEGSRITTWVNESAKFFNHPFFGTGFHHRGGLTGLWAYGSHNFWLQIWLETGLMGGLLLCYLLLIFWRHCTAKYLPDPDLSIALRCTMVAAFVGGLGGEYFYGGMGVFTLMLIYSITGHRSPPQFLQSEEKAH